MDTVMNLLAAGDVTTWAIVAVIGVPGMGALASDLLNPIRATLGI